MMIMIRMIMMIMISNDDINSNVNGIIDNITVAYNDKVSDDKRKIQDSTIH